MQDEKTSGKALTSGTESIGKRDLPCQRSVCTNAASNQAVSQNEKQTFNSVWTPTATTLNQLRRDTCSASDIKMRGECIPQDFHWDFTCHKNTSNEDHRVPKPQVHQSEM